MQDKPSGKVQMKNKTKNAIIYEVVKSKTGLAGVCILGILVIMSAVAITTVPINTFKEWNNPGKWITYPKTSIPVWVNLFMNEKIPEHKILDASSIISKNTEEIFFQSHQMRTYFDYDGFPNDIIYEISAQYTGSPFLQLYVIRPDGMQLDLLSTSLPNSESTINHKEKIFSTNEVIKKNIMLQSEEFKFSLEGLPVEDIIFSDTIYNKPLKGDYIFVINLYGTDAKSEILKSQVILGGKAFGIMGTDELRRDLAVGLLLGTPLALFIGITVAVSSVIMGLFYGVYAGYVGKKKDEAMMRFNDVIYALPALPFLIILSVTISNSIFVIIGFLMIFGWVGIAKVARSMSLQIKTRGYVEASSMMGQKDSKIMLKHILPQLLPYAFASIAISVPAAITTEAGLSFLGLGDPSFPTWGQILHDASTYGATARGIWWWILPPGMMIAITGLAFVFIGNALDKVANPKLKR